MLKSKIKTHKVGATYNQPHFFILNKGYNCGKPCAQYWANCFVFLADDQDDMEYHYHIFMGLWELQFFRPVLIGSVVDYIRLGDLIDVAEETLHSVNQGDRSFASIKNTLQQIEDVRNHLQAQLRLLVKLRKSIFHKYLRA